jgi:hypothetical protein
MSIKAKARAFIARVKNRPEPTARQKATSELVSIVAFGFFVLAYADVAPVLSALDAARSSKVVAAMQSMNARMAKDLKLSCSAFDKFEPSAVAAKNAPLRECTLARLNEMNTTAGAVLYTYRAGPWLTPGADVEMGKAVERALAAGWNDLERNTIVYDAVDNVYSAAAKSVIFRALKGAGNPTPTVKTMARMLEDAEVRAFAPHVAHSLDKRRIAMAAQTK